MTDAEREVQIRRHREIQSTPLRRMPWGEKVYGWTEEDIDCLLRILDETHREIRRLRDAIVSARQHLAKGRALWNGPCHECDARLERGLTGADAQYPATGWLKQMQEVLDGKLEGGKE